MSEHDWTGTCPACRGLCIESPGHALVNAHLAHVAGQLADAMTFDVREQRWSDVFDAAWDSGEPLLPVLLALADQELLAAKEVSVKPPDVLEEAAADLRELVEFSEPQLHAGLERAASRLEDLAGAARYRHMIGADLPMEERRARARAALRKEEQ